MMTSSSGPTAIILHPEAIRLRDRLTALRHELTECFDERLRLGFEEIPALRYRYTELFGELERNVQERTLELSERKRMVELFALKLDRGQKLDAKMVELVLRAVHNEFGRIRTRVDRAFNVARRKGEGTRGGNGDAQRSDSPREQSIEVKRLYRRLARRLHPDLRGGQDELSRRYWELAREGNMRGDLPLLRTLIHLVEIIGDGEDRATSAMQAEEHRLREAIRIERSTIESLRGDELYALRDRLDDEGWQKEHREEIERELEEVEREIARCDTFLAPILSLRESSEPQVVQNILENFVETMYFNNR